MRKFKVYGVMTFMTGEQRRTIAAVHSQKEFAALTETTVGYIQGYASETGNEEELRIALAKPGIVFILCPECDHFYEYQKR